MMEQKMTNIEENVFLIHHRVLRKHKFFNLEMLLFSSLFLLFVTMVVRYGQGRISLVREGHYQQGKVYLAFVILQLKTRLLILQKASTYLPNTQRGAKVYSSSSLVSHFILPIWFENCSTCIHSTNFIEYYYDLDLTFIT